MSAQIPCAYCTFAHTEFAKLNGASDEELGEAIGVSGLARHWSTYLNGLAIDEAKYRAEIARVVEGAKKAMASKAAPPAPIDVVDAKTTYRDVEQMFGFVPEFLKLFPEASVAGAWRELRDLEMSPTKLSNKDKSLISLAVAAQVPCRYCVFADAEFAKLEGATDAEIREAVAMAAVVRHWSTLFNGRQVELAAYKKDILRIIERTKKEMKTAQR